MADLFGLDEEDEEEEDEEIPVGLVDPRRAAKAEVADPRLASRGRAPLPSPPAVPKPLIAQISTSGWGSVGSGQMAQKVEVPKRETRVQRHEERDEEEDAAQLPDVKAWPVEDQAALESTDVQLLQAALRRAKDRLGDFQRREAKQLRRLAGKERQVAQAKAYAQDVCALQCPSSSFTRKVLLDPSVALEFRLLRDRVTALEATEARLREEIQGHHFTPNSASGQALVAKCQKLTHENEELGRRIEKVKQSEDNLRRLEATVHDLEGQVAQKQVLIEELDMERGAFATMVYTLRKQLDSLMASPPLHNDNNDNMVQQEEKGAPLDGSNMKQQEEGGEGGGAEGEGMAVVEEGGTGEGEGEREGEGEGVGGEDDLLFADLDDLTPMQSD